MTYTQAEQYILSFSNIPRTEYMKNSKDCATYLKRVQFFLDLIGNPERKIPHYIHVTGTSGKGSVCSFLQSILVSSGKKTGLYVSPHPTYLFERWKVNNTYMTPSEFVKIVIELKPFFDRYAQKSPYDMVSYFDITTIIGLYYFAQKKVEWAVIEVGCGGRFDATNILPWKDIAIITNIGLDHTEILGKTKEKIAYEKAGIIKPKCTVFTMEKDKKVLAVIEKECIQQNVLLHRLTDVSTIQTSKWNLIGRHQVKNAIFCKEIARFLHIPEKAIERGLTNANQPLRMEIVSKSPLIILDGAHNEDKMQTTVETIHSIPHQKIHLVVGFSADKTVTSMIQQLAKLKPATVACTRNTVNPFRKVSSPMNISQTFKKYSPKTKTQIFLDPNDAFLWSKKQSKKNDIILATGSIFLSGELRKLLQSD